MLSQKLAVLLKKAREQLDMSREELAKRAGVSYRLVAELERGQRQHVSLESALKLLNEVGVSITATAPNGDVAQIRSAEGAHLERLARAAQRRKTWKGSYALLHQEDLEPRPPRSASQRVAAVSKVSTQAFVISAMKKARSPDARKSTQSAGKQVGRTGAIVSRSQDKRAR